MMAIPNNSPDAAATPGPLPQAAAERGDLFIFYGSPARLATDTSILVLVEEGARSSFTVQFTSLLASGHPSLAGTARRTVAAAEPMSRRVRAWVGLRLGCPEAYSESERGEAALTPNVVTPDVKGHAGCGPAGPGMAQAVARGPTQRRPGCPGPCGGGGGGGGAPNIVTVWVMVTVTAPRWQL